VRVDLQAEPDLLEDRVRLVAPGLTGLHVRLVLELAEVHELATGGRASGRDLDEVEIGLLRQLQRLLDADDADLLPVGADQPHLGTRMRSLIRGSLMWCSFATSWRPSRTKKGSRARTPGASPHRPGTRRVGTPTSASADGRRTLTGT
jgi:hypothetical protein